MTVVVVALVTLSVVCAMVLRQRGVLPGLLARAVSMAGGALILAYTLTHVLVSTGSPAFWACLLAVTLIVGLGGFMLYGGLRPRRHKTLP